MEESENRHWVLARRPWGAPQPSDFEMRHQPVPEAGEGDLLVRVLYAAMDPAIRGFMGAGGNYASPIALGSPVRGMILGQVMRSRSPAVDAGRIVFGFGSWSDYVVGPAAQFHPLPVELGYDLPAYLHALGTIGLTAYYGLIDIAKVAEGDCVLVSGAAGAVGSLVGQMARIRGASRVVGIAGGAAKCRTALERYGYDECIDYKACGDLSAAIGAALPEGIDVFFDNVGGATLEAAIDHLAKDARIALCGMISGYNATAPQPGPANLWNLVVRTARIHAFRVTDILDQHARTTRMLADIDAWIRAGKLVYGLDVREGFEAIPASFACLFTGEHDGRLMVRVAEPADIRPIPQRTAIAYPT
jgi:NADPH-dependent curcumin reductase CurA